MSHPTLAFKCRKNFTTKPLRCYRYRTRKDYLTILHKGESSPTKIDGVNPCSPIIIRTLCLLRRWLSRGVSSHAKLQVTVLVGWGQCHATRRIDRERRILAWGLITAGTCANSSRCGLRKIQSGCYRAIPNAR